MEYQPIKKDITMNFNQCSLVVPLASKYKAASVAGDKIFLGQTSGDGNGFTKKCGLFRREVALLLEGLELILPVYYGPLSQEDGDLIFPLQKMYPSKERATAVVLGFFKEEKRLSIRQIWSPSGLGDLSTARFGGGTALNDNAIQALLSSLQDLLLQAYFEVPTSIKEVITASADMLIQMDGREHLPLKEVPELVDTFLEHGTVLETIIRNKLNIIDTAIVHNAVKGADTLLKDLVSLRALCAQEQQLCYAKAQGEPISFPPETLRLVEEARLRELRKAQKEQEEQEEEEQGKNKKSNRYTFGVLPGQFPVQNFQPPILVDAPLPVLNLQKEDFPTPSLLTEEEANEVLECLDEMVKEEETGSKGEPEKSLGLLSKKRILKQKEEEKDNLPLKRPKKKAKKLSEEEEN